MRKPVALIVVILLASLAASAEVQKRDVDIKADDGANLKATLYSAGRPGPGILLLHQCNHDRKSWDNLATMLTRAGFNVLTMDYRGYGESDGAGGTREERRSMRAKWPSDVDAAYRFLTSQPGVNKDVIGAGGASCGVHQSIQLARKHSQVRALVLLSGRTDPTGMTYIKDSTWLSIFGAASEEDTRSAQSIREILALSGNKNSKLMIFNDAGHGVPMFSAQPDLMPSIVEWVSAQLR